MSSVDSLPKLPELNKRILFTLFILTVAAAEAAIGLAIIVVYFRNAGTIRVEEIEKLKLACFNTWMLAAIIAIAE